MHQNLIVVSSWSMGFLKKKSFFIFFSRFISKYIYLVKNDKHCFKVIKKNHVLEKQNLVKSISSSRFVLFVFF